jgi:hypothetical protein
MPEDDEQEVSIQDSLEAHIYWLVMKRQLGGVDEMNRDLADIIREREKTDPIKPPHPRQYRAGFSTGTGFLQTDHPSVSMLRFLIEDAVNDYVDQARRAGYPVHGETIHIEGWGFLMRPNDWVCPHSHGPGALAGVYYVHTPELKFPEGCLEFVKPYGMSFGLGRNDASDTGEPPETRRHMPKPGQLLLFPSEYIHLAYPFHTEGERIAIGLTVTIPS